VFSLLHRTLLWCDLDASQDLAAGERPQLRRVALRQCRNIAVAEREGGLNAVEHEDDMRWWDTLMTRRHELVGAASGAVILVALKIDFLLRRSAFFDQRLARLVVERLAVQ
jgi:hypothetical protein